MRTLDIEMILKINFCYPLSFVAKVYEEIYLLEKAAAWLPLSVVRRPGAERHVPLKQTKIR